MANKLIIANTMLDKNKLEHYGVSRMKWESGKVEAETQGPQVKGLEGYFIKQRCRIVCCIHVFKSWQ